LNDFSLSEKLSNMNTLGSSRVEELLHQARRTRILVIGDVMLDQFIWGRVSRISPEAPVPVVDFQEESFMPGGAANVARNLTSLGLAAEIFSIIGDDPAGLQLEALLRQERVGCHGLLKEKNRSTSIKTRIIAHQQQVVRVDRESGRDLEAAAVRRLLAKIEGKISQCDAVIVGDYGKGVVTQTLLDEVKKRCRRAGIWLSLDPKPVHPIKLNGLSLITPNRKEAFELAGMRDGNRADHPLSDKLLIRASRILLEQLQPAILLITIGDQGMLLCQRNEPPVHIPTAAQEVFDVSGAGDTVIASFTMAIAAGASPLEAAILSNHAAGVVVGKIGTAKITPNELAASFTAR
jgi:D-glycero-beta-D-manno-heptose-7-phosphate kinase